MCFQGVNPGCCSQSHLPLQRGRSKAGAAALQRRWGRSRTRPALTYPGRVGLVELVEHDDGGAAVVVHQPPEVGGGVLQGVQGDDEGSALGVALQRGKRSTLKDMAVVLTAPKPPLSRAGLPGTALVPSKPWCWGDAIKPGQSDVCPWSG